MLIKETCAMKKRLLSLLLAAALLLPAGCGGKKPAVTLIVNPVRDLTRTESGGEYIRGVVYRA